MATIAVHEFISLDGVYEDPSFTIAFGWDPAMGETLAAITGPATTILLGRRTHEMFAPAWRERSAADDEGVAFFNDTEKLVVGSSPSSQEWSNTTHLGAYDVDVVRRLKEDRDGVIYVSGSGTLVRALLQEGLVDALHLFVYPVALGTGERFFDGIAQTTLSLTSTDVYDNGVIHLCYGPATEQ